MKKIIIIMAIALMAFSQFASSQLTSVVVSLTGSVMDQVSRDPIGVRFEVFDQDGKRITRGKSNAAQNGYYFVTGLKPGNTYSIRFTDLNYFKEEFQVKIPATSKYEEFSRDFLVLPKKEGIEMKLQVPPFELNKSKLRAGSDFFLKSTLNTLQMNNRLKFELHCFPDNAQEPTKNQELTNGRCQALRDYFIKNQIQSDRIKIVPHKETDDKNPPPTEKRAKGKRYIGPIYIKVTAI